MLLSAIYLVLPFLVCLFWTMVYVLDWHTESAARRVLAYFLAVCTLLYACHAVFFDSVSPLVDVANCIYVFCNLAVFPLYYLYILCLTRRKPLGMTVLWALTPAILISLWAILICDARGSKIAEAQTFVARLTFIVELIIVCVFGFLRLKEFDRKIDDYFSDRQKRTLRPTEWIMGLLVVVSLFSATANSLGREYFYINQQWIAAPSLVFSILLFALGYVGTKQTFTIDDLTQEDDSEEFSIEDRHQDKEAVLAEQNVESAKDLYTRFVQLIEEDKLYLMPDLRLADIAERLCVGRTSLSKAININSGDSFSDYVNRLRVEHACALIADKENAMSMLVIGEKSGFSSESSFYRTFRKFKGLTPKAWEENKY